MRIEFDTNNPQEVAGVAALVAALQGSTAITGTLQTFDTAPLPDIVDDRADPAQAFAAPPATGNAAPDAADTSSSDGAGDASNEDDGDDGAAPPQVDGAGIPWDARIHSSPPKINKSAGTWRQKRGVDEKLVADVTAELQRAMAAPAPTETTASPLAGLEAARQHLGSGDAAPPPPPPATPAPPPPPPAETAAAPTDAPPAPPATPVAADTATGPAAAAPAADGTPTFADLMRMVTSLQTAGKLQVTDTKVMAESLGLSGLRDLMHRPDLIPSFVMLLPDAA